MAGHWGYVPMQDHHARQPRLSTHLRSISLEYSYQDLCHSTSNWHASRKLGSGSYGAVYKGEMGDGSEVAIKAIDCKALAANGQSIENAGFEEEVQMLSKFRHPNLVTLMGWGKTEGARYLVYELLQGGDAFQRLAKSKNGGAPFFWYERLSVCYDASLGLSHMHNAKPQAFHRDIKSANVLLDRHGTAKMADFGLSCTSNLHGATSVQVKTISGTPGYACPIYSRTGRVTEGSEVYSFGMVMLELLCAMAPAMADPRRPGSIIYPVADNITPTQPDALSRALRHTDPGAQWMPKLQKEFAELGLRCVSTDDKLRPKFKEVVQTLRRMMEAYPAPEKVVSSSVLPSFASQVPQLPGHLVNPQAGQQVSIQAAAVAAQGQLQAQAKPQAKASAPPPAPAGNAVEAIFYFLLTHASGINADAIETSRRKLLLPATVDSSGIHTAVVGRQHQPELFEAWLPDFALRNCISRTAFELTWNAADNISFIMRGANPMVVDGKQAPRGQIVSIRPSSEVGFLYAQDERKSFLTLKLMPVAGAPGMRNVAPPVIEGANGNAAKLEVQVEAKPKQRASPPPHSAPPEAQKKTSAPSQLPSTFGRCWLLECTAAEGLSSEALANLQPELRYLVMQDSTVQVGRQHQPNIFEALLSGATSRLSFISRTHVSLEVRGGVLNATNLSSNPIYIDKKVLERGESRPLAKDQLLSFARNEGAQHVNFITFRVRPPEDKNGAMLPEPAVVQSQASSSAPRSRRPTTEIGHTPSVQDSSALGFKCYEGAVIGGTVRDVFVGKMTTQEARIKAASLPECVGFTYEGAPSGGPYTIFFKAEWQPSQASGWCAYRKKQDGDDFAQQQQQRPPGQAPAVSSSTSPRYAPPPASSGYPDQNSPQKRFSSDVISMDALLPAHSPKAEASTLPATRKVHSVDDLPPSWHAGNGGSRLPETRRVNGANDLPDSWRRPSSDMMQDPPTPKQASQERGRMPATSSAPPAPQKDSSIRAETRVVLELSGDGVLPVPIEQRRIGPVSLLEPVLVGRRHQQELHRLAVQKECLQYLSRDHFQITYIPRRQGYEIMAMTSNPIWLFKRWPGSDPIELKKDESVPMEFGDRVGLGTGTSTTNAEEAINRLCWTFRCYHEDNANYQQASSGQTNSAPYLEERSPSGAQRGNPWDNSESQWEPMLPPASSVQQRHDRNDRPSEMFAPEARGLSSDHVNGGGNTRSSGVMRPPVDFMGRIPEDGSPGGPWGGTIDITRVDPDQFDAFSKSGFSYR